MDKQQIKEQIIHFSKELRLPTFRRDYKSKAEQSATDNQSYEAYLLSLIWCYGKCNNNLVISFLR